MKVVAVNGVIFELGVGTRVADCFWSNDQGKTALGMRDTPSPKHARLYWNVLIAGFDIKKTDQVTYCGNPIEFARIVNWVPNHEESDAQKLLTSFAHKLEAVIEKTRVKAKAVRRELAKIAKRAAG